MASELCSGCLNGPLESSLVMICEHRLCLPCAASRLRWPAPGSSAEPSAECPRCGASTDVETGAAHQLRAFRGGAVVVHQPQLQQPLTASPARVITPHSVRPSPNDVSANHRTLSPPRLSPVFPTPSAAVGVASMAARGSNLVHNALMSTREEVCGQCQEASAELHCRECRERFCAPCSANLHQRGRLREHTVLPLSAQVARSRVDSSLGGGGGGGGGGSLGGSLGVVDRSKSPLFGSCEVYCPLHPEDHLQFFCLECESECICAECAVHGEHKGHDVLNVRHAYKNMNGRIADALSKAQARTSEQQKVLQLANSQRQEVEVVIEKGKQAIQDAFEKMRTSLGQKEAQLLRDAEATERAASEQLQSKRLMAEGLVRSLQEAQAALKKLDTRGDEVRALNTYAKIRAKVLTVLGPMDGLDNNIEHELEDLKSQVQRVLDMQVAEVATLSSHVADIRRTDAAGQ